VVREAVQTSFLVTNVKVAPQTVKRGRPVTVSAAVTNAGEVLGVDQVTLKVDGLVAASDRVWLGPRVSREVEFIVEQSQLGTHTLDLNGVRSAFVVRRIVSLAVIAAMVGAGLLLGVTVLFALRLHRQGRLAAS
jgi:hypothetical protein